MGIKQTIFRNLSNLPGWRTNRKIVVFESDDWGSIRMPSNAIFNKLTSSMDLKGSDSLRYNKNDTLASSEDLSALYHTLSSFKDCNKHSPVFTAISIVANPDFSKIEDSNFAEYYYEPFTSTLEKYGKQNAFRGWKEGIESNLFVPQFHGREHLNVAVWMKALQEGDKETRLAFENGLWGFNNKHRYNIMYQAAFDVADPIEITPQQEILKSGLELFEELFNYKTSYFVPPNGPINNILEKIAAAGGVKYMAASKIQKESLGEGSTRRVLHYLGQKNKHNQTYITRNAFFEPSQEGKDWPDSCLSDINIAFKWHKPAVISSHRVNYIGGLDEKNRTRGLTQLKQLLNAILKKWPNVEFMTSNELGDLITKND